MKYLADIFVAIFIIFFVLYSLNTKTKDYVKIFIAYFVPFIIVFLAANPIYLKIVKLPSMQSQMTEQFVSQAYLNGYLATEVILYVLLVLVFKILFRIFTHHKLLVVKKEDQKPHKLIQATLALFLGYMMSFVLITLLGFVGVRTDAGVTDVLFEKNFLVDLSYVADLERNIEIYDIAEKADEALSPEPGYSDRLNYITLMETYARDLKNNDTKYLLIYANSIKSETDSQLIGLDAFMWSSLVSKYQDRLFKGQVIKEYMSEKILASDSFADRFAVVLAKNEGFDLEILTAQQLQSMDEKIDKLQLNEAATAKMKQLYH
jgi:hypothetical protein